MMNGGLKSEVYLLYGAFPIKVFTKNSSYASDKHFLKFRTKTGINGENFYTFTGSNSNIVNSVKNLIELTNGAIDLITDNDLNLDSGVWNRSKSIIKLTAEGNAMPEQKQTDILNEYKSHPLLPLYGNNPIPYYNETFAAKMVNYSSNGSGSATDNNPTIAPYLVEGAKKCVIIFPGGGYFQRSDEGEGIKIANEYNKNGYSAFVVRYRVGDSSTPKEGYNVDAILSDGQRAVQFVRYNAKEFGIYPNKIAVCGFSAGGHLSMMVSQNEHKGNVVGDRIGEISSLANATILSYAVTTMGTGTFSTMPKILSGDDPDLKNEIIAKYSGELNVTTATPPTFIWYGKADTAVSPQYNSIAYYNALQSAGVYAEKYSYTGIGHGVGLSAGSGDTAWHARSVQFLNKIFG